MNGPVSIFVMELIYQVEDWWSHYLKIYAIMFAMHTVMNEVIFKLYTIVFGKTHVECMFA